MSTVWGMCFFLMANFGTIGDKKDSSANATKGFFLEKNAKFAIFWGKKSLKSPYLDSTFPEVAKSMEDSNCFLLSFSDL